MLSIIKPYNTMIKKLLTMGLVAMCSVAAEAEINVIPRPAQVVEKEGKFHATSLEPSKTVQYKIDKKVRGSEAYTLSVTPKGIVAKASTQTGLFYAKQTLLQLIDQDGNVPCVEIKDAPRFSYRGLHLDPCRHFFTVEETKKQIDLMAQYKLNTMHWHLTEDQGWRIEIKKYPELLQYGAQRVEGDGSIHKGYYTQEEIKDVVAYAAERHITVVPELEIPGHELAAIAAFPNLTCRGEKTTPRIVWGVEDIVMCPGKEDMFTFLQDVIDEMVPLFPSKLFHIGGDESPRGEWEKCPKCQARMKAEGLTKEAQLQSYVIGRIEKYLRAKGKTIIGWDEILEGGNLDTTAVVMSWRGEEGGIIAGKAHHHVLMTPGSQGLYFDHYQGDPQAEVQECIGGYSTLEKVYSYDPVPQSLREAGAAQYVLGVQANNWSEYIHNDAELEWRIWPRALALAEIAWSPVEGKDFADFQRRVDGPATQNLLRHKVNFHIPSVEDEGGSCDNIVFLDTRRMNFKTTRPLPILYTLDGTEPTAESLRYHNNQTTGTREMPLTLTRSTVIKARTMLPGGILGPVRTINAVKVPGYQPAAQTEQMDNGLKCSIYYGGHRTVSTIQATPDEVCVIDSLYQLRNRVPVSPSVRNVKNYAAIGEGYVEMPADGIYEFHTQNTQLWIDGKLVVDNSASPLQRNSRMNAEVALQKGLHEIKVIFLGGIFTGWPTYWDDASVTYRVSGTDKWSPIRPGQLFH